MKEAQLRQDIIDELEFDPSFNGEHVGITVDKDVVTPSGDVNSCAQSLRTDTDPTAEERRVQDALEDDDVREALKLLHARGKNRRDEVV
jgi:hypothetical protein